MAGCYWLLTSYAKEGQSRVVGWESRRIPRGPFLSALTHVLDFVVRGKFTLLFLGALSDKILQIPKLHTVLPSEIRRMVGRHAAETCHCAQIFCDLLTNVNKSAAHSGEP